MLRSVVLGAAAGAAGTAALNITTYLDMVVRGRASSEVPAQLAGKLAARVGVDLASESAANDEAKQSRQNRRSGMGALMGYVVGLGVGVAYGFVRPRLHEAAVLPAGAALGAVAMASSDLPAVALGVSNPRTWGIAGWAADIVPHLVYGIFTAMAFESFTKTGPAFGRLTAVQQLTHAVGRPARRRGA